MRPLVSVFSRAAVAFTLLALCAGAFASPAAAAFTRLQVLLPGETAAPGTGTGKTGTPRAQTAGVPFTVTVRACDANWNLQSGVTDAISMLCSDASATLPAPASCRAARPP